MRRCLLLAALGLAGCGGGQAPTPDERQQIAGALDTLARQCVAISAHQDGADPAKLKGAVDYLLEQADQAGDAKFRSGDSTVTMPQLLREAAAGVGDARCAPAQAKRLRDAAG
jgi:hypothetical protein